MINIAVLGYGTVGSGVVEVIRTNHELINKRAGEEIKIKYVLDLREFPGDPVEEILVHDFEQIVNDPEVKIVVEVMGGTILYPSGFPGYPFQSSWSSSVIRFCQRSHDLVRVVVMHSRIDCRRTRRSSFVRPKRSNRGCIPSVRRTIRPHSFIFRAYSVSSRAI